MENCFKAACEKDYGHCKMADRFRYLIVFKVEPQAFTAYHHSKNQEQKQRRRSQLYAYLGDEYGHKHQDGSQEQQVVGEKIY